MEQQKDREEVKNNSLLLPGFLSFLGTVSSRFLCFMSLHLAFSSFYMSLLMFVFIRLPPVFSPGFGFYLAPTVTLKAVHLC